MKPDEITEYMRELSGWFVFNYPSAPSRLRKEYAFKNFTEAMVFINRVAGIADTEGHHPDIFISYNKVRLELWTHAIGGLSENDFIVAAKIDADSRK
ncbi:MAG: 4a-hydroxytetrahydrobiopterin dehydratase [Parcubacteria group bacterium Gr01-1014_48]|nr:MAG: 4a-hydroxytetrahydrobiopterin dehydratase [Parcubacteria group bacterium Gr01-1014_48]